MSSDHEDKILNEKTEPISPIEIAPTHQSIESIDSTQCITNTSRIILIVILIFSITLIFLSVFIIFEIRRNAQIQQNEGKNIEAQ